MITMNEARNAAGLIIVAFGNAPMGREEFQERFSGVSGQAAIGKGKLQRFGCMLPTHVGNERPVEFGAQIVQCLAHRGQSYPLNCYASCRPCHYLFSQFAQFILLFLVEFHLVGERLISLQEGSL